MRPEVGKDSRLPRNSESTCFFPGTGRKHREWLLHQSPQNPEFTSRALSCRIVHRATFRTSGTYLLAISGGNDHISVYSVNNSSGDAAPVAGSPFVVTMPPPPAAPPQYARSFRLDPARRFVYVLESSGAQPNPASVAVFSFSEASGTLAPVQSLNLTSGYLPASLVADQSRVFVVSEQAGTVAGNIHVFRRDANTGMLMDSGNSVTAQTPFGQSAEMRFGAECQSFEGPRDCVDDGLPGTNPSLLVPTDAEVAHT
jgi:hypothetical protein